MAALPLIVRPQALTSVPPRSSPASSGSRSLVARSRTRASGLACGGGLLAGSIVVVCSSRSRRSHGAFVSFRRDARHTKLSRGCVVEKRTAELVEQASNEKTLVPDTLRKRSGAEVVQELYDSFNRCDADGTANCFTSDVIYEDLLLGASTIVESREDFRELIKTHPVFVTRGVMEKLQFDPLQVDIVVDSIAEDTVRNTVGVEWHVEVGGEPLALGRGLSHMKICPETGLIRRAVDLVEAPWRAIGLFIAPFARGIRGAARLAAVGQFVALFGILATIFIFLDRPVLESFRADIDALDDFRGSIDKLSTTDVLALVGREVEQRLLYVDLSFERLPNDLPRDLPKDLPRDLPR